MIFNPPHRTLVVESRERLRAPETNGTSLVPSALPQGEWGLVRGHDSVSFGTDSAYFMGSYHDTKVVAAIRTSGAGTDEPDHRLQGPTASPSGVAHTADKN